MTIALVIDNQVNKLNIDRVIFQSTRQIGNWYNAHVSFSYDNDVKTAIECESLLLKKFRCQGITEWFSLVPSS